MAKIPASAKKLSDPADKKQAVVAAKKQSAATGNAVLLHEVSGTGKTMTAVLLGKEAGHKELHTVDVAALISKYAGETEKNLERVFAEALQKNWVLVFDEADALFGKRTDVKDSNDRYANIDPHYLLAQAEKHPGLVVFTTRNKSNIDEAFLRRLRLLTTKG